MREPGDTSGVARVTFPNDSGTYVVSYVRVGNHSVNLLGDTIIIVPDRKKRDSTSNTNDTEAYSPRYLQPHRKKSSTDFLGLTTKAPEETESRIDF